jgi:hypothetical protein
MKTVKMESFFGYNIDSVFCFVNGKIKDDKVLYYNYYARLLKEKEETRTKPTEK